MDDLTFERLRDFNIQRSKSWMSDTVWTSSDWGMATAGELGEACNAAKKLKRIEDGLSGNKPGETKEYLQQNLADELGDTVIYLDLWAKHHGIDLGKAVRDKFNATSKRIGMFDGVM